MKTLLSWSSGKDSAWSLLSLKQNPDIEVRGLFTMVNEEFDRVAMHGVQRTVLEAQAEAAGLPLYKINIPFPCSNIVYEQKMSEFIEQSKEMGIEAIAFGDLFLEDIRNYRVNALKDTGIEPIFPLWLIDTRRLAREMIEGGLETWVSCVDPRRLDPSFAGRKFDENFLSDLPDYIDPCGENGEFHTMVTAGPMFNHRIEVEKGEVVERDGFVFADFSVKE